MNLLHKLVRWWKAIQQMADERAARIQDAEDRVYRSFLFEDPPPPEPWQYAYWPYVRRKRAQAVLQKGLTNVRRN